MFFSITLDDDEVWIFFVIIIFNCNIKGFIAAIIVNQIYVSPRIAKGIYDEPSCIIAFLI